VIIGDGFKRRNTRGGKSYLLPKFGGLTLPVATAREVLTEFAWVSFFHKQWRTRRGCQRHMLLEGLGGWQ
jgi:hypothetical protein